MSRKKHQTRSQKLGDFRIDFGRHRGKRLRELPADYLFWVASDGFDDKSVQWIAKQYLMERQDRRASGRKHRSPNRSSVPQHTDANASAKPGPRAAARNGAAQGSETSDGPIESSRTP